MDVYHTFGVEEDGVGERGDIVVAEHICVTVGIYPFLGCGGLEAAQGFLDGLHLCHARVDAVGLDINLLCSADYVGRVPVGDCEYDVGVTAFHGHDGLGVCAAHICDM